MTDERQEPKLRARECDRCDGCGTYEGGKTLLTTCEVCGGCGFLVDDGTTLRALTEQDKKELQEYWR